MKIDRLISIIMILLEKERIGAHELAEMFEVSPRTIYRDIDTINTAGIPVRGITGLSGGFEIMPEYKVDKKIFSSSDLSAILMGLSSLSDVIRGDELANALAKVKSFVPDESAESIELNSSRIYVDLSPWVGNPDTQKHLESIKTAMQESRIIFFEYTDNHGNTTSRIVEPYQLVLKNSHWYFQGYCLIRNDFRLFKLSRISSLQIGKENFTPREYQKPQLDFSEIKPTMQTEIKLRIHKSIMDRVLDFCSYERFAPDGNEHYFVDFPFIENDYNYDFLLGFGEKCECLSPPHIRAEIKRRIGNIAELYNK